MKFLSGICVFVTFVIFTNGCGSNHPSKEVRVSKSPSTLNSVIPADNIQQATQTAKQVQVSCASSDCSSSVGMLSMTYYERTTCEPVNGKPQLVHHSTGSGICTFFLVQPDVIVTDSHCVPPDLKNPGSSCTDRIWFSFPHTIQYSSETVECNQVLLASEIDQTCSEATHKKPDYAFIKLSRPVDRPVLRMSQEGLPDQLQLTVIKVNPASTAAPIGVLEQKQCTVNQNNIIIASFDHPQRPIALLSGCEVVEGNSGSPVIDANGYVRAILYATKKSKSSDNNDLEPLGFSFATNAACIPTSDGINKISISPECGVLPYGEEEAQKRNAIIKKAAEPTVNLVEQQVKQWGRAHDPRFEWTVFTSLNDGDLKKALIKNGVGKFTEVKSSSGNPMKMAKIIAYSGGYPQCFNNPNRWLDIYKHRSRYDSKATIEMDTPIWVLKVSADKAYKPVIGSAQTENYLHAQIRFSPKALKNSGKSHTEIWLNDDFYGSEKIAESVMDTCKPLAQPQIP